jgi:hypothetical protein
MQGRDEEQVRQALAALRRSMEPVQAPPELEARLLAAYRRRRRPPWWKRARVYGAVAATLLLGAAGWTWSVWRQPLPRLAGYPPVRAPLPPERQPSAPHGERPAARLSAARKPAKPVRWQDAPPAPVREEVATEFLLVQDGGAFERGRLIRVRVPRPALANFGLPFDEDRAAESVHADVLVGEDGLIRAVRFVQP